MMSIQMIGGWATTVVLICLSALAAFALLIFRAASSPIILLDGVRKGHAFTYFKLSIALWLAAVISWLYMCYAFVQTLFSVLTFSTTRKGVDQTTKNDSSWAPLRLEMLLKSSSYDVCYVCAPVAAPGVLMPVVESEGMNHAGLLFRSDSHCFVVDYCASDGMFSAVFPETSVGISLIPPEPTIALRWNNDANVFVVEEYDASYWKKCIPIASSVSRTTLYEFLSWCDAYRLRYNRYSLWSVWDNTEAHLASMHKRVQQQYAHLVTGLCIGLRIRAATQTA